MTNTRSSTTARQGDDRRGDGVAFLLAQIGAHAAAKFAERLGPLGLTPAHVGSLRIIAASAGASQQDVADKLGMFPSRLVALVDELEERGLVAREENESDRRTYSLAATAEGKRLLADVGKIGRQHQDALLAALNEKERDVLASLLRRIAEQQGLRPGVHPGFARLRPQGRRAPESATTDPQQTT